MKIRINNIRYYLLVILLIYSVNPAKAQYFNERIDFGGEGLSVGAVSVEKMNNGNFLLFAVVLNPLDNSFDMGRVVVSPDGLVLNELSYSTESGTLYSGNNNSSAKLLNGGFILSGSLDFAESGYADLFSLSKYDPSANMEWIKFYGDSVHNMVGNSAVQHSNSNLAMVGWKHVPPPNQTNGFLLVTDSSGEVLSLNQYGGSLVDHLVSVFPTFDGGYILGGHTQSYGTPNKVDHYIVKTDSLGNEQWMRAIGSPRNDCPASVIQTQDGNYVFCGCWNLYDITSSTPMNSLYMAKLNSASVPMWDQTYGDSGSYNQFNVVKELPDGKLIAAGIRDSGITGVLVKTDADGNEIWYREYKHPASLPLEGAWHRIHDVIPDGEGGFVATGYIYAPPLDSIPGQDLWVFRTDSMGCVVPGCHLVDDVSVPENEVLVNMYPNPVDDLLSVHLKSGPMPHGAQLKLFDMQGRQHSTMTINPGATTYILQLGHLPSGMYVVRCVTDSQVVWSGKVFKE